MAGQYQGRYEIIHDDGRQERKSKWMAHEDIGGPIYYMEEAYEYQSKNKVVVCCRASVLVRVSLCSQCSMIFCSCISYQSEPSDVLKITFS